MGKGKEAPAPVRSAAIEVAAMALKPSAVTHDLIFSILNP
jgi:hypothetical protein